MRPVPLIIISYKNISGEAIPAFAPLKFSGDCEIVGVTGAISVKATKPDGGGPYAIDSGKGAAASGAGAYGQCFIPLSSIIPVKYNGGSAPATAWVTEVGPVSGQWYMDGTGTGYLYAGVFDSGTGLIWVIAKTATSSIIIGRATTTITPASNSLTGATTFSFKEFQTLNAGVTPHTEQEAASTTTGVNRFTKISAGVDSIVVVAWINGEWQLIGVQEACPT